MRYGFYSVVRGEGDTYQIWHGEGFKKGYVQKAKLRIVDKKFVFEWQRGIPKRVILELEKLL